MKSLELINERIEDLESKLESSNYLANDNPSEFGKTFISDLSKRLDSYKQIKQYLEVLEIIRKKEINIQRLRIAIINTKDIEDTLLFYNCGVQDFRRLTLEELLKIKQWLEENENG